ERRESQTTQATIVLDPSNERRERFRRSGNDVRVESGRTRSRDRPAHPVEHRSGTTETGARKLKSTLLDFAVASCDSGPFGLLTPCALDQDIDMNRLTALSF